MSRVYVAGASKELERAEAAIEAVWKLGHEVTFDWPAQVRRYLAGAFNETPEAVIARTSALACVQGLRRAEVVWFLLPDVSVVTAGMWWEHGFLCGRADNVRRPAIMTSGPNETRGDPRCIFASLHVDQHFTSDKAALTWLRPLGIE